MSLLDELLAARAQHRRLAPPSETHPLSLADAYATQDRLREALLAAGERLAGWKAGFTNRATQAAFGCEEPVASDVVADGVHGNAIVLGAPLTDVAHLDLAAPPFSASRRPRSKRTQDPCAFERREMGAVGP